MRPQADGDYLMGTVRRLGTILEYLRVQLKDPGVKVLQLLDEGAKVASEATSRPSTNGEMIDNLRREVGDLRSRLIDEQVLRHELGQAKAAHASERAARLSAESELHALHDLVARGKVGNRVYSGILRRVVDNTPDRLRLFWDFLREGEPALARHAAAQKRKEDK